MTDYEYKYFSDEDKLLEMIQYGPVVSWIDVDVVSLNFKQYKGGVYFNKESCVSYEEEEVPHECRESYGKGYTCLGKCKSLLPLHCDRCVNEKSFSK